MNIVKKPIKPRKEYVDIDGVKAIFTVVKEHMNMDKKDLLMMIKENTKSIKDVENNLEYIRKNLERHYYTKREIDSLLPIAITIEEVEQIYKEN